MSNVITMTGTKLVTVRDLLDIVAKRDDVEHVVEVVSRKDGFLEVLHDRQPINNVVMAASVLSIVVTDLARGTIDDDA